MTYNGVAQLGINIDTAAVYDADVMVECLAESVAEFDALGAPEE